MSETLPERVLSQPHSEHQIDHLAEAMRVAIASGEATECPPPPVDNYFGDNIYARRIYMPAGTACTSRVHKTTHITIVLTGRATVVDQDGVSREYSAPDVFVTKKGTQRALFVHEDSQWVTVHHCVETDMDEVAKALVCATREEYNQLQLEAPV